jgi:hypothetical protein
MPDEVLARLLGLPKAKVVKTLAVILEYGVASLDEHGILVNRRMVRDEEIRKIRTEAGKKGGNPTLVNQKPSKQVKQKSTPSSSSSSSVSTTEEDSATQAETAEKPSPVSRRIWTDGVQLLTESGIKNHDARSLLGKLGRDYGQTQLAECIAATMAANPVNPEEWLIGALKNRKNGLKKPDPGKPLERSDCDQCASVRFIEEDGETVPCPTCKAEDYEWVKSRAA